jgi:hypothetical protein
MKITVLGSCRQDSLRNLYSVSRIGDLVSFPHYSKEILQVLSFCRNGEISPERTLFTFRTPILSKCPLIWNTELRKEFDADFYVVEVASKITYEYGGLYLHHIAAEEKYNVSIRNDIISRNQSYEEIENDLLEIRKKLVKPMLVVSHIVTYESGERYRLACWLEEICKNHSIPFMNPIQEIGQNDDFFGQDKSHWSELGHKMISMAYKRKIDDLFS